MTEVTERSAFAGAGPRAGEADMRAMAGRFAHLLRSVGDGATPVPGMRWTVSEIGAHVVQSAVNARDAVEGRGSAYAGIGFDAGIDERMVAALPERDPARLADLVERSYVALAESLGDCREDQPCGVLEDLTPSGVRAILALDFMLHGSQIAGARGRDFEVPAQAMRRCAALVLPTLARRGDARDLSATFSLRLRGADPLLFGWDRGRLWVDDGLPHRVDCHLVADPEAFLLQGIGLFPLWKLAVLGRMLSYGRRPWLSLRVPRLIPAVPHGGVAA